jgi:hypothetical protein
MFRITTVRSDLFEFVYASQFRVSVPCVQFKPIVDQVDICQVEGTKTKFKDAYPDLSALWLRTAQDHIVRGRELTTGQVGERCMQDWWSGH